MASDRQTAARARGEAARPPDPVAEANRHFREEILPEELAYVRDRRQSHGLVPGELAPRPTTRNELVGLGLSGGGIRAATFDLGLLQALERFGLFRHLDYLSTVSGGGFIGSSLTALLSEPARKEDGGPGDAEPEAEMAAEGAPAAFPFPHGRGDEEEESVRYLRGHSDYLAPQGLTDYLLAFALLARGIGLNLILLLPILMVLGLAGMFFATEELKGPERRERWIASVAERLEAVPLEVDFEYMAAHGSPFRFSPERVESVLREPPALIGRSGGELVFADGVGWRQVAERLAVLDDRRRAERLPVLDSLDGGVILTYRHDRGLEVVQPASGKGGVLWTDASPIAAATVSSDRRQIAASGYDGSLWLFYPEEANRPYGHLQRPSGRKIEAGGPALEALAFTEDGSHLVATTADGETLAWATAFDEPEASTGPAGVARPRPLEPRAPPPPDLLPVRRARPELREAAAADGRPGWSPTVVRLPQTYRALKWLAVVFVGLFLVSVLFGDPLGRLGAAASRAARAARSRLGRRKRPADSADAAAKAPPAVVLARRLAASVLFGLVVFGGSAVLFARLPPDKQGYLWPFLGFGWMVLWLVLSLLFLLPFVRRMKPRRGTPEPSGPPFVWGLFALAFLAVPWAVAAAGVRWLGDEGLRSLFMPDSPASAAVPFWLLVPAWWIASFWLVAPVFWPRPWLGHEPSYERQLEWHRRVTGRVYAAAHLLLWLYLVLAAYHEVPREIVEVILQAVFAGLGGSDAVAARLAPVAFVGYLAGVQYLLWRLFAALVRRERRQAPARVATEGRAVEGGGDRKAPAPKRAGSSILWRDRYERLFSLALLGVAAIAALELQPYAVYRYRSFVDRYSVEWLYFLLGLSALVIVLAAMFLQSIRGVGKKLAFVVLGVLGPLLPVLVYLMFVDSLVYEGRWLDLRWLLFGSGDEAINWVRFSFLPVTLVVGAHLLGKVIDANSTGMHAFYRDRLSQAYLVGVDADGVLGPEEEMPLSAICRRGTGAPYHLLNASLNMQGARAGAQRWRSSDFFFFSRFWCGGPHGGYCRTEHLEHLAPEVHLGSAMAVSAAAAAPNMGTMTSGFLVMLMTLLNVRLGLWLPTPRRVARMARLGLIPLLRDLVVRRIDDPPPDPANPGLPPAPEIPAGPLWRLRRWWLRFKNRPSGYRLVDEMASRLGAGGRFVNLSDGGHLENTGAYELLRRRCRLIVVSDAESDPEMRLGALAALMRYAAIDLGVEIDIDPGPLRPSKAGASRGHWALGTIRYPAADGEPAEKGRLLYVKASVTGDESEIIREYRARHTDFPQESTADQVFEEDQFEAYRALGYHIGEELFTGDDRTTPTAVTSLDEWLDGLDRTRPA